MLDLPGLKGKKAVLTGAYGVFGVWMAEAFRDAGVHLCLSGSKMDKLEAMAAKLNAPQPPLLVPADLREEGDINTLVKKVADTWGAPDFLVNNAGMYRYDFVLDMPTALFDAILAVNVRAPFLLSREMGRLMIRRGVKGSIVNISSSSGRKNRVTSVPYSLSKAAVNHMSPGLALEFAPYGIRVNVVEPGFAPGSESNPTPEKHVTTTSGNIPLGRTSGPDDVPGTVLFLCSESASYITGANIYVDGGASIGNRTVYLDKQKPATL